MEINYIGEHLFLGTLGRTAIGLSFLMAILSVILYLFKSTKGEHRKGFTWARIAFWAHLGFLTLAFVLLYVLIFSHYFEYQYVTKYSSKDLPFAYLVSSIWAGQEGSFMLWAIFQAFLGGILVFRSREWEGPAMVMVSLSQAFLMVMVLGWKFGSYTLGSDPFILMRNLPENLNNTLFASPDYLKMITDGQGLNPLLENIWMAIHPPLLFLGYAATLIPFSLAIAGLWKNDHSGWRRIALPWLHFAGVSLGVGIILGGAWAYVSLTFGGFWAWDPVENASLIPWLFVVATMHVLLVSRKKPQNILWVYIFGILSYFFVIYASYLTRSGILSESSAHAFGDEGRSLPLLIFTITFLVIGVILLIIRRPAPLEKAAEQLNSKEFWVFIGSIVLALSGFQIILTTSIPVFNKILGTSMAPPADVISFYNSWQLPYAILIALLIGFTQFMKYGESKGYDFLRKAIPALAISLVLTALFFFIYPFKNPLHYIFLFFIFFMIISSIQGFMIRSKKQKNLGALLAHFGLGLFLLGVLLTFSHTQIISGAGKMKGMAKGDMAENTILTHGDTISIPPYKVMYADRQEDGKWLHYTVTFFKESRSGTLEKVFDLHPAINRNEKMGYVYEPATNRSLSRDIFGYITHAQSIGMDDIPGYSSKKETMIRLKDSVYVSGVIFVLDTLYITLTDSTRKNLEIIAQLRGIDEEKAENLTLRYVYNDRKEHFVDDTLTSRNWLIRFRDIGGEGNKLSMYIFEKGQDYIVMKIMIFPYIQVMWAGTLILFLGFLVAIRKRLGRKQPQKDRGENT